MVHRGCSVRRGPVQGVYSVPRSALQRDARFDKGQFTAGAWFDGAQFAREAGFDRARFSEVAWFREAQFSGPARFSDAQISGDAWFRQARFSGSARFSGTRFSGNAWFDREVQFREEAWFRDAQFTEYARFDGAQFSGDALFDRVQVTGEARFSGARFTGEAQFSGAKFTGKARFDRAQPTPTWFDRAQFSGPARFDQVQFTGPVRFDRAKFTGDVWFDRAQFSEEAWFDEAQFSEEAQFDGTQFTGEARFREAQFQRTGTFGSLLAASSLVLDRAMFGQSIEIRATGPKLSCVSTQFLEAATLRLRYADILLIGTVFSKPSTIAFARMPFTLMPADGQGETLDDRPLRGNSGSLREDQPGQPRLLSLHGVDVATLTVSEVDLSACLFEGSSHLDQLRIEGARPFADAPAAWRLRLDGRSVPVWRRWARRQTLAEEHRWRSQLSTRAGPIQWSRLTKPTWYGPECQAPEWVDKAQSGQQQLLPDRLALLYRALRKGVPAGQG